MRRFCLAAVAALSLVLAMPAGAQIFSGASEEELNAQREDIANLKALARELNEKIILLQNHNKNLSTQMAALTQQRQALQQTLRQLKGDIETLSNRQSADADEAMTLLRQEVISLQKSRETLEEEIAGLRSRVGKLARFATLPPEEELYNAAFALYRNGDYADAVGKFSEVTEFYPEGQFAINAHYWTAQAHLKAGDFPQALTTAFELLEQYPDTDKSAETLLITAKAYIGLQDTEAANRQLQIILEQDPTSLAADQARELLSE